MQTRAVRVVPFIIPRQLCLGSAHLDGLTGATPRSCACVGDEHVSFARSLRRRKVIRRPLRIAGFCAVEFTWFAGLTGLVYPTVPHLHAQSAPWKEYDWRSGSVPAVHSGAFDACFGDIILWYKVSRLFRMMPRGNSICEVCGSGGIAGELVLRLLPNGVAMLLGAIIAQRWYGYLVALWGTYNSRGASGVHEIYLREIRGNPL